MKPIRLLLLLGFACAAASSARAQLPDVQVLADQMAQAVSESKLPTVIVVDFFGPDEKFTTLGITLADRFDDDLRKTAARDSVQARGQMRDWLQKKGWPLSAFKSVDLTLWVAGQLKVDGIIAGNISIRENEITIEANLYRADTREWVKGFQTSSRMSVEAANLAAIPSEPEYQFDSAIAISGRNGYTVPKCTSCPESPYVQDAIKHRTQGSVLLTAIIEADGSVGKLTVRRAMPDGLTDSAEETVRQWKFEPAIGPDGRAARVQHTIQITFHFRHDHRAPAPPAQPHQ